MIIFKTEKQKILVSSSVPGTIYQKQINLNKLKNKNRRNKEHPGTVQNKYNYMKIPVN